VVRVDASRGAHLTAGEAGCPACSGAWVLTADHVVFSDAAPPPADADVALDADAVAALLALAELGLRVWLDGVPAPVVRALQQATGVQPVLADPPEPVPGAVSVHGAARLPFGDGSFAGVCLLRRARSDAYVASAVATLSLGGRLVALESHALPLGVRELARAGGLWVAERVAHAPPIPLRRA